MDVLYFDFNTQNIVEIRNMKSEIWSIQVIQAAQTSTVQYACLIWRDVEWNFDKHVHVVKLDGNIGEVGVSARTYAYLLHLPTMGCISILSILIILLSLLLLLILLILLFYYSVYNNDNCHHFVIFIPLSISFFLSQI